MWLSGFHYASTETGSAFYADDQPASNVVSVDCVINVTEQVHNLHSTARRGTVSHVSVVMDIFSGVRRWTQENFVLLMYSSAGIELLADPRNLFLRNPLLQSSRHANPCFRLEVFIHGNQFMSIISRH